MAWVDARISRRARLRGCWQLRRDGQPRRVRATMLGTVPTANLAAVWSSAPWLIPATLLVPLALLRWYQQDRVRGPAARSVRRVAVVADRTGAGGPGPLQAACRSSRAAGCQPSKRSRRSESGRRCSWNRSSNAASVPPGTTMTFRYNPAYPDTNFSRTIILGRSPRMRRRRVLFEPVYTQFQGVDVSDPSPACLPRVSAVDRRVDCRCGSPRSCRRDGHRSRSTSVSSRLDEDHRPRHRRPAELHEDRAAHGGAPRDAVRFVRSSSTPASTTTT